MYKKSNIENNKIFNQGMLKAQLLSEDINGLCELIDKNSGEEGELDEFENFTIYESLAFMQ